RPDDQADHHSIGEATSWPKTRGERRRWRSAGPFRREGDQVYLLPGRSRPGWPPPKLDGVFDGSVASKCDDRRREAHRRGANEMAQPIEEFRKFEGRQVSVALADGSRIDDCSLVSAGRGRADTVWVFVNG